MFRVNLDNLVKPCLKTKMLLKKLRKADRLELRSGVKDSKWKGGIEKENWISVLVRIDPGVQREQKQMFLFNGANFLMSLTLKVHNRYTIFKECHGVFEF